MNKDIKKTITGVVVSVAPKTVIVEVTHAFRHPLYKKAVNRMKKFAVHNEKDGITVGDKVQIVETKPISKNKHYKIV